MTCSLCGLPTPDPPVTDPDTEGEFCCRGCLAVASTLDEPAAETDAVDARAALDDEERGGSGADDVTGESTTFLSVSGMHCTTCEAFLEARAESVEGVANAAANYPTGTLKVEHDPERAAESDLESAVSGAGYEVGEDADDADGRLLVGAFFGMMTMCWYVLFLYPAYLGVPAETLLLDTTGAAGRYLLWNVLVMTTVVLGYTGAPVLRGAYVSVRAGEPNMDLLVGLAASAAYVYSVAVLLAGGTEVYFDVATVVVLAVTVGNRYEKRVRERVTDRLSDLTEERVETARVRADGGTREVRIDALEAGQEVVVRAGERVPIDAEVVEGTGAADESLVTGEATPVEKRPGENVVGGSLLTAGGLVLAVPDAPTSTVDHLLESLWEARSNTSGARRLADRLAAVFVPAVLVLSALTVGWRLLTGAPPSGALLAGVTVLVVSCPCALGLATPLAVTAGVRRALDAGVVVTDGALFERAPDVETVVLDKTGTLTTGEMRVLDTAGAERALDLAAAVEQFADHPVAAAIADAGDEPGEVERVERHATGVSAVVEGESVLLGRRSLFDEEGWDVPAALGARHDEALETGRVPTLVGWDGRARGVLVCGDDPRDGWNDALDTLGAGREVAVLTGDDERAAARFERHPAVNRVLAGVPPDAKAEAVSRLRETGPVAMVGDGSNDAPALAAADVGVAMGEGTQLAADAADAVVTGDLESVADAFGVLDRTNRRIRENLLWACGYNAVAVPLAVAGVLTPVFAAAAMAASSLLVVANSVREV